MRVGGYPKWIVIFACLLALLGCGIQQARTQIDLGEFGSYDSTRDADLAGVVIKRTVTYDDDGRRVEQFEMRFEKAMGTASTVNESLGEALLESVRNQGKLIDTAKAGVEAIP